MATELAERVDLEHLRFEVDGLFVSWHCLRLAGIDDPLPARGRLFAQDLP